MTDLDASVDGLDVQEHITLDLLSAVDENSAVTQRSLANELGVALGLANSYIKRCAKKGLIKVQQAPANRFAYYLTPRGFAEKSRLSAEFLKQSLKFFRISREQAEAVFGECDKAGWIRVGLVGKSELAEIAILSAVEKNINLVGIIDAKASKDDSDFMNIPIVDRLSALGTLHALVITDTVAPQKVFDEVVQYFPRDRVKTLPLMKIRREKPIEDRGVS